MVSNQTVSPQRGRGLCVNGRHAVNANRLHFQNAAGCRQSISCRQKSEGKHAADREKEGSAYPLHKPSHNTQEKDGKRQR